MKFKETVQYKIKYEETLGDTIKCREIVEHKTIMQKNYTGQADNVQ